MHIESLCATLEVKLESKSVLQVQYFLSLKSKRSERLPPHLQVADFLGQLLDEVVGPDVVGDLAGGLAHLQRPQRTSVQAGGVNTRLTGVGCCGGGWQQQVRAHLSLQPGPQRTD